MLFWAAQCGPSRLVTLGTQLISLGSGVSSALLLGVVRESLGDGLGLGSGWGEWL